VDRVIVRGELLVPPLATASLQPTPDEVRKVADVLPELLKRPTVRYAAILSPEGAVIRATTRAGAAPYNERSLGLLRGKATAIEPARQRLEAEDGSTVIDITLPVFSYRKSLAQARPGETVSQLLIAYLHLGIGQDELFEEISPFMRQTTVAIFGFALLSGILCLLIARHETAPLSSLEQIVEDVTSGRLDRSMRYRSTAEINRVISMVNILMAEVNNHKLQFETDNKLLSLQIEQSNRELHKRNEELNDAVQKLTQSKHQLYELAFYDPLTMLPNRRLFLEEMQLLLQLAIRHGTRIGLLFIDLDNFKRINDSLGHRTGDMLLKEVGTRLKDCLRSSDLAGQANPPQLNIDVARFGGDEFTVVLTNIETPEEAGRIARRLLKHLQAPMQIGGHELIVTPSIGIAIAPDDAADCDELLKLADTAMYDAKSAGRNSISFFRRDMLKSSVGRLKLEADLRKGIARGELLLHYQPQICAETGNIMGAEALVRWQCPERGLVPPGEFIPIAEEMGLIVDIGAWTLLEACRNIAAMTKAGLSIPKLSVNVSSLQFNSDFTNLTRRALEEYDVNPALLELELTEGVIMGNAKASIAALYEMKSLGVSLSVDDFGTGYSSLSYLSQFPLDELKIDRSFIVNLTSSRRAKDLVRAIIAMGKSLNLRLVAEGVDSLDQFRFLRNSEVDLIQGFLFSKPVPMEQFIALIKNNPFREQLLLTG
jgi:diguanylate cyclase (GGDEF)-like protein